MINLSEETIQNINRFTEIKESISIQISKIARSISENVSKIAFDNLQPTLNLLAKSLENLSESQRKVIDELTKCAWYMNGENGIYMTNDILNLDKEDPRYIENIDEIMLEGLKVEEEKNQDWIIKCFQDRESILRDALEDHNAGRYNCSIPVFLNQIDGITRDLFKIDKYNNFFKKVPQKVKNSSGKKVKTGVTYPYTKEIANKLSEDINKGEDGILYSLLIYPLERLSCLCYDSDDIDRYIDEGIIYCNFSRHGIIHGRDVSYGTEVNSYKCISILLYLCTLKEMLIDKNEVN